MSRWWNSRWSGSWQGGWREGDGRPGGWNEGGWRERSRGCEAPRLRSDGGGDDGYGGVVVI